MELSKEAKEARNKYYKEWRKKNLKNCKLAQKNYWEKKALAAKNIIPEGERQISLL